MTYVPKPYPRMLVKGDDQIIVENEQAEAKARADGFRKADEAETADLKPKRKARADGNGE